MSACWANFANRFSYSIWIPYLATKINSTIMKIAPPSERPTPQPTCVISRMVATSAAISKNYKFRSLTIIMIDSLSVVSFI